MVSMSSSRLYGWNIRNETVAAKFEIDCCRARASSASTTIVSAETNVAGTPTAIRANPTDTAMSRKYAVEASSRTTDGPSLSSCRCSTRRTSRRAKIATR